MLSEVTPPTPVDADDVDAIAEAARRDGAVFLPGLIDEVLMRALRDAARGWLMDLGWIDAEGRSIAPTPAYDAEDFVRLQQWAFVHPAFDAIRRHRRLVDAVSAAMGKRAKPKLGDLLRVMSPRDPPSGTLPHQDAFYVKNEPELWTVWTPLIPTSLELGPVAVWPGSMALGELEHHGEGIGAQGVNVPDEARWSATEMMPGDVWMFGGHCIHRTLGNHTADKMRISVDFRYVPDAD